MSESTIPAPSSPTQTAGASPTPSTPSGPAAVPTGTPPTTRQDPYAAVSAELSSASTWEALGPSQSAEPTPDTPAPSSTAEPAADAARVSDDTPDPATDGSEPVADQFAAYQLDEIGRLHRPDGTFADASEIEAYNATATEPAPGEAAPTEASAEPEPSALHQVEIRKRDGTTRTIEVDDPELADELRTNAKDGMRAREYREKVTKLDAQLAEINAFQTLMETNPEHVVLELMPLDRRIAIATAIIAEHWDALAPTLVQFDQQPETRLRTAIETQRQVRAGMDQYQQTRTVQQQAATIASAVTALLPETMPEPQQQMFLADAQGDIVRAAQAGQPVTPETIPQLLAPRMALYGLTPGAAGSTASPSTPPAPPSRPLVRAVAPTGSTTSPTAPSGTSAALAPHGAKAAELATVAAQQHRLRTAQQNRRRAAAVPPVGAGAAPTRIPLAPPGTTVQDASKALRQQTSW